MFDVPIDGWYGWLGATLVAAGLLGVAAGLPTAPPPDANRVADSVDSLAASDYAGEASVSLESADEVRITTRSVSLRGPGGTAHATFAFGAVTPVTDGELAAVLNGSATVRDEFGDPAAFAAAAREARTEPPEWHHAPGALRVRHVTWGGVDVTLVG